MSETTKSPMTLQRLSEGRLWLLRLSRPKANVIDAAMVAALHAAFDEAKSAKELAAVVLCAEGPHFSFGASVQEHLPDQVAGMLSGFHALFHAIVETSVPVLAAVRGQCLGGGLELASFAHRLFVAPDARLGQPEIVLGAIAPVASLWLPERVGRGAAEDLCLSGRSIDAEEALRIGLVDVIAEDPEAAALDYAHSHLLPHSASSLRHAVRATRGPVSRRFLKDLAALERTYLDELMQTHDGPEGVQAFVDKRKPEWRHA